MICEPPYRGVRSKGGVEHGVRRHAKSARARGVTRRSGAAPAMYGETRRRANRPSSTTPNLGLTGPRQPGGKRARCREEQQAVHGSDGRAAGPGLTQHGHDVVAGRAGAAHAPRRPADRGARPRSDGRGRRRLGGRHGRGPYERGRQRRAFECLAALRQCPTPDAGDERGDARVDCAFGRRRALPAPGPKLPRGPRS
jgi:hypothetical protein